MGVVYPHKAEDIPSFFEQFVLFRKDVLDDGALDVSVIFGFRKDGFIDKENLLSFYLADFLNRRRFPDERFLLLGELVGDRTFLALSHFPPFVADGANANVWQFPDAEAGWHAFEEWDLATKPEPSGWDRHPRTMCCRTGGDASKEEVLA